ncbi:GNAT family N-acetyltransferase [Abyssalbus ytuae]|uniref:GNAT family N-acetyltransferase n=1 Tax=Abyssalbus ytuae TaxID=2926907 RepID=UPI0034E214D6
MKNRNIQNIELKFLDIDDYQELKETMIKAYPTMPDTYWKKQEIKSLVNIFKEGQIVIKVNNQIAGCALSLIVDYSQFDNHNHTYRDITGNYTFNTHTNNGDVLYGIEVFVKPGLRGLGLGRKLYDYRKNLCKKLNLRSIAFGGRMPGYSKYSKTYTPNEYLDKVKRNEIKDLVLSFQISNDFLPVKVLKGYLEGDKASNEYAVLMEWDNLYYQKTAKKDKFRYRQEDNLISIV